MKIILFIIAAILLIGEVSAFRIKADDGKFDSWMECMDDSYVNAQKPDFNSRGAYCHTM